MVPRPGAEARARIAAPVTHARAGLVLALMAAAPAAVPQEAAPVYQTQKRSVTLKVDALFRQEWTRHLAVAANTFQDDHRWRGQLRPRLEIDLDKVVLGVGGDFNYSSDKNTKNLNPNFPLVRDNYKSRDARLDLAFARLQPARWLRVEGGRFVMPVALTEMIWDRDLRPQGGALTLDFRNHGGLESIGLTVLGAKGSHVFDDDHTSMLLASLAAHPGEAVRRHALVGAAWPDGAIVHDNTLDVYVARLRRKLRELDGAPEIQTVHGVGYSLA